MFKCLLLIMARINLVIDDELDEQFRIEVAKRLGMKKGNIKIAIEEALHLWIGRPKSLG
jgi:hypothetical protein